MKLVLGWGPDTDANTATGRVVGIGNSMISGGVVGCLQIGQVTTVGGTQADHPDAFYLKRVEEACRNAGLGAITRVRGKAVWSMAPHLGKARAGIMESLQGQASMYHCSDYMYPSSMTTAMCYAARLAKRVAMDQGHCTSVTKPIFSQIRDVAKAYREWSAFKGDLARARKPSTACLTTAKDDADDHPCHKS